ncbi:MAG TPA: lipoprotein insertase outer membrane protein LolB [Aquabacterium sp.]|uniref:lipoprotein insertase outer membrane protein LolB n=1 Tax=Aquabacterium sp. TaxID=1872578 RepID=UPI002E304000|nr:lipoprotein insertase outer membrane protein LolB [Aquabacterium sp.]HEX5356571.1 lipoprotein insertase outer membrane protein LolB [Aquabacterium sp.]
MIRRRRPRILLWLLPLSLTACASLPDTDPIAAQMRSGGNCAPADAAPPAFSALQFNQSSQPVPRARPKLELQGQMSIKLAAFADQAAKGLSLGFFFSGNTDAGQLDLMTLMGSQIAQVNWQPGEAWLTNDKGRQRYDNLEALSLAALGESLPLRSLIQWMQGQPDLDLPSLPGPQANTFTQEGWLIDTNELPEKKLHARREASATQRAVQLKIYLDR